MTEDSDNGFSDFRILQKAERYVSNLRPFLRQEGSDILIRDCKDGVLYIIINGACIGCTLMGTDLPDFRKEMMEDIPELVDVIFVSKSGIPVL